MRDTARIKHGGKRSAVALDLPQVYDLRVKLAADQNARDWDLLDFVDMMLATGKRIGENSAITWDGLDLDAGTVEIRGTVIRVKGQVLCIKSKPKTKAGYRKLRLPAWAVEMLRRRQAEATPNENEWGRGVHLADRVAPRSEQYSGRPSGVFTRAGYPWVTSHVSARRPLRCNYEAGVSARKIADQLGHSQVSVTQDFYMGRKIASEDAARVLEIIGRPEDAAALIAIPDGGTAHESRR